MRSENAQRAVIHGHSTKQRVADNQKIAYERWQSGDRLTTQMQHSHRVFTEPDEWSGACPHRGWQCEAFLCRRFYSSERCACLLEPACHTDLAASNGHHANAHRCWEPVRNGWRSQPIGPVEVPNEHHEL